ncbi:MAG: 50S ribosomal protein L18 [Bacteriovoracaceae bacterium]
MIRKSLKKFKQESSRKRYRRKLTIRNKVEGTAERPRIVIHRSNKNIAVQVIDDAAGKTLASAQTFGKAAVGGAKANKEGAALVGKALAEKMTSAGIKAAVYDRAGYKYHGVVKQIAESIRENGVQI